MKTDEELKKILRKMEGKSEEEKTKILLREGILVRVRREFKVNQRRRKMFERFKIWIKHPSNKFPNKWENILMQDKEFLCKN